MNTKEKILKCLEENRDRYISGEELGSYLNISRTAIWKGVQSLKNEGFIINSTPNKGYKIDENCDKLSRFGIINYLGKDLKNIDIRVYESIDSTNTEAKRLLYSEEIKDFTVLIANEQTQGRGRRGRTFLSPEDTGIYFSIILFPKSDFNMESLDLITIKAAVAVAEAISKNTEKEPKIKWVNDIFTDGKKICGILSEADSDFESRQIKSIVVGIGINFNTNSSYFKGELNKKAGSLNAKNIYRNELAAKILNEFYSCCYNRTDEDILKTYKGYSLVLGKKIEFTQNDVTYEATAIDINYKGNLLVEFDNGNKKELSSGEISIKGDFYL
ncbi:biotin-[acetyl-CoA-carboxylase] ligase [Peptoniphilus sp. ING2-D1G]|nr:biotin-[acetyl-CoA-carboxylase] ligase [Peptoniphilus sp. ING2-D1G]